MVEVNLKFIASVKVEQKKMNVFCFLKQFKMNGLMGSEIKFETRGFAYEKMLNNTRQHCRLINKIDFAEKENVILSKPIYI